jgi:hypothetical protein
MEILFRQPDTLTGAGLPGIIEEYPGPCLKP